MKPVMLLSSLLWVSLSAQVQVLPFQRPGLPSQGQATGKASIEGSVLDAITREPVKKASVAINGPVGLSAVTDASGHFAFRQLPAGRYNIFASNEKYPSAQGAFNPDQQLSVSVAAEEQKQDVTLSLTPGASVRGRIVDEEGNPMSGCNVAAMQFRETGMGRTLQASANSQSDEKGEYRVSNIPRGKYYLQARCFKTVPLPHAFVRRTSSVDVPRLTYTPVFYPGAPDLTSAAKVQTLPGADVSGIDFRMAPARGVTIRGHVGAPSDRNIQLTLSPKDPVGREMRRQGARVNSSTGEFQIPNVPAGSYDLVAITLDEGHSYFAKVSVEVSEAPLDPIDLTLAPAPSLSGSMSVESDLKVPINNVHLMMFPLEGLPLMGSPPQADVQNDGSFAINSVMPGHWRLNVNGAPGYVKSVRQGDQEVSPWDLEIGPAGGQLKIIIGTKWPQVVAALAAPSAGSEPVSALLWAASGDPQSFRNIMLTSQGPSRVSVPPGKYYACAIAAVQPWALMQNSALRKALEGRCATVEATEEADANVQLPLIPADDLKQLLEKIEE
jgi:hypothetical protein